MFNLNKSRKLVTYKDLNMEYFIKLTNLEGVTFISQEMQHNGEMVKKHILKLIVNGSAFPMEFKTREEAEKMYVDLKSMV